MPSLRKFRIIGFALLICFSAGSFAFYLNDVAIETNQDLIPALQDSHRYNSETSWRIETNESSRVLIVDFFAGGIDPLSNFISLQKPSGINESLTIKKPIECASLEYSVYVPSGFDFVKGGKLPGLAGGTANTGGRIPNGFDGFSSRLLWKAHGLGAIYAYLPTSTTWGSAFGSGRWTYRHAQWTHLKQTVKLNDPQNSDGSISLEVNGNLIFQVKNLTFRKTSDLKIDSILVSSFFGGNNASFAPSFNQQLQFKELILSICDQ